MSDALFPFVAIAMGIMMLAGGIAALYVRKLLSAIIIVAFVSLTASVMFLLMDATDVAVTEAAIGAVVSTMIFLWGRGKCGGDR